MPLELAAEAQILAELTLLDVEGKSAIDNLSGKV